MRASREPSALHRSGEFPGPAHRIISITGIDYPEGLRDLSNPPPTLYVRGNLPTRARAVAIVGSRAASSYGIAVARRLAGDLARLGLEVVSGLARGIDTAAHEGALEAGGMTVAVVPCGLEAITPRSHRELAERMIVRGGLLTEWESGGPRARSVFVQRNRLIAALASAVVVVEAAELSGALSTAAVARRLGRPLLAVPGDVDRPTSRGCHALIRAGAGVCESAGDVVRALPGLEVEPAPESQVLAALDQVPRGLDALAERAGLPVERALPALLHLQWAGAAESRPGQRWVSATGRDS